ncbi:excinuclease ABC subunit C [Neoasaia chiangmaiensis NBRC 101099]|uniref:UvrABC system protein C n=1 Tax=Neoasaia chiangmaiensis TaxID=320497 RepID=A0A1U9KTZ3_9PROT|nr:excinuclease ABC subunit UvrC [Neoasaia chiangmaiensis]AQS89291.1 excinuclease ABC subunit C [Neoasaia chiangmaiensis]GBR42997.1 excinuclease ABC subunit C [Neoasaia chiangmaiensis NBRC 101099]GEN16119.1 UvrABC system protein C [Neoasaia chiangmaiensis]
MSDLLHQPADVQDRAFQEATPAGASANGLRGVDAIKEALKTIPLSPGVYRMLGAKGEVLYVGKARSLKKRVTSYTRPQQLPERLRLMIASTVTMEVVTTHTEADALLLEANYIKRMKPRFNILLRDDKSYPWLMLTENHPFAQITKQRGKPVKGATYWGPFASAWSVNQTLNLIQRSFLLRSCSDSVFNSRTRPCLLYQIRRCSAPCVDRISQEDYAGLVEQARQFLSGKNTELQRELVVQMEQAAESLQFERAAAIRDRIRGFASMQNSGIVNPTTIEDADVVAVWQEAGQTCIQVFFIRGGRNNGNRAFFPAQAEDEAAGDVLSAFLLQFYDDKPPPPLVLVNADLPEQALIEEALSIRRERKVEIARPQRGEKKDVLDHAALNAREALERRLAESAGQRRLLEGVATLFDLPDTPRRIETYDNSHIMGQNAYGVMVVGGPEGFNKRAYRKYLIRSDMAPGDDFAMMREVMERRFGKSARTEDGDRPEDWPDLLLIDGGLGQFNAVREILTGLGVTDVPMVAIAKGPDRDAGREWFHMEGREPFQLPPRDPVLYYLQRLRDEAHRFAITTHRAGRSKGLRQSELDTIPGIGAARKRALLNHFGSARGVKQAGLQELADVAGINSETARTIYGHFHPEWTRGAEA